MVMLLKKPAAPTVVPSPTRTALAVLEPLITTQFFKVSFTTGVVPADPIEKTLGTVTLVLAIVRLRSVEAPPIDPLKVTRFAPFNLTIAFEEVEPLIVRATPLGWKVMV